MVCIVDVLIWLVMMELLSMVLCSISGSGWFVRTGKHLGVILLWYQNGYWPDDSWLIWQILGINLLNCGYLFRLLVLILSGWVFDNVSCPLFNTIFPDPFDRGCKVIWGCMIKYITSSLQLSTVLVLEKEIELGFVWFLLTFID